MGEAVFQYFIHNGELQKTSDFEKMYIDRYPSVYEVIRIIDGVPLFLEEHYKRFLHSAEILGCKLNLSFNEIKESINKMIKHNNVTCYNIKLVVNNLENPNQNSYYFFINSKYPEESMYKNGVETFLYRAERKNPNAKVIDKELRGTINQLLKDRNCFEAILVNQNEEITEGSRSNIFFIKGQKVLTALEKDVLQGITRQRIMSQCSRNGIEVEERIIPVKELSSFNAAFICGTSPKVLPISLIDNMKFSTTDKMLLKIMDIYNSEIENYIRQNK